MNYHEIARHLRLQLKANEWSIHIPTKSFSAEQHSGFIKSCDLPIYIKRTLNFSYTRGSQPFPDLGPHSLFLIDSRAAVL
jgi:hypothetical protein